MEVVCFGRQPDWWAQTVATIKVYKLLPVYLDAVDENLREREKEKEGREEGRKEKEMRERKKIILTVPDIWTI